jgi:fused signal recognition particle receptor
MGLLDKFKPSLKKTAQMLNTDIRDIFKGGGRLVDDSFTQEFFEKLVKTDMGVVAAQELVDEVVANFKARVVEENDVLELIKLKLKLIIDNRQL